MFDIIRKITPADKDEVIDMMSTFYASEYVSTNGSEQIFDANVLACISGSPYVEGYVFDDGTNILGYAMLAKSYSTEFGKNCIWIEDIYIKEQHRAKGIASRFFEFLQQEYKDVLFRLEVEKENERAINLYKKYGFDFLPYFEMKK